MESFLGGSYMHWLIYLLLNDNLNKYFIKNSTFVSEIYL